MKVKALFFFLVLLTSDTFSQNYSIEEIFNKKFQTSFISRGDNLPDFNISRDSRNLLLVCLHNEIPISEFQAKMKFDDQKMVAIIDFLKSRNWLHQINSNLKPSVFVVTKNDGEILYKYAEPISKEIAKVIKREVPTIRKKFTKTDISKTQDFKQWDFLILSNVLLDNWQIFNVENEFLGASARPLRHGKNYYASISEITSDRESFDIYGNQFGKISVYGNNRAIADLNKTDYFVNKKDDKIFNEIASDFLPKLVNILRKNKQYSEEVYHKLGYSKEISFEEFYMWWYHFIYTKATDIMHKNKTLTIPKDGNFVYEIEMN